MAITYNHSNVIMKKMTPLIIALLSSVLAIIAAWYQYQEKESQRIEKEKQTKKADDFQSELLKKTQSLDSANIEIRKLQSELLEKTTTLLNESKEVQRIQDESIKFMTGEGIPTVNFFIRPDGSYSPIIYNKTNYPIYDVRFRIDNFDEIIKCKTKLVGDNFLIDRDCIDRNSTEGGPFFLAPGQSQGFNYNIPRSIGIRHFRVQVVTRKQVFTYLCIVISPSNYRIRIYSSSKDYRLILLEEQSEHFKEVEEKYWNDHFYADKKIMMGPVS